MVLASLLPPLRKPDVARGTSLHSSQHLVLRTRPCRQGQCLLHARASPSEQSDLRREDSQKQGDTGPQQPVGPSTSDTPEDGDSKGPQDQRPLIVKILVSVFLPMWQTLGRLMGGLPRDALRRVVFSFVVIGMISVWRNPTGAVKAQPQEVLYSQFVQLAKAGLIHSAIVDESASVVTFSIDQAKLKSPSSPQKRWYQRAPAQPASKGAPNLRQFHTRIINKDTSFVKVLVDAGVLFGVKQQSLQASLMGILGAMFGLWIPLIPFLFILKRLLDSQSGKSKTTKQNFDPPNTTFADVAGVDVVKEELQEAVLCLRDPAKFEKLHANMPSGVLLSGPPGTGKTLLARAVAGEAGVPFFAVSASEFVEMFVGRGAARIRELFQQARKAAPAVIFIDELDAVGSQRGLGVNDERDQTLNQLLTELDGFEQRPSILLLAATNRPEVLDKALLRPGRISRRIIVPLPDEAGRRDILSVHMREVPMEDEEYKQASINHLAIITPGFSGAELYNVVNEGALLTARRDGDFITLTDLAMGVQRTRDGVNARKPALSKAAQVLTQLFGPRKTEPARASPLF